MPIPLRVALGLSLRFQPGRSLRAGWALGVLFSIPEMAMSAATGADAPVDTVANYSHTMTLQLKGNEALVPVPLPAAVYLHARSASLHDVRVFDADGRKMAFAMIDPAGTESVKPSSRRTLPVRVFPVKASDAAGVQGPQLDVRTSRDGTLLSVTTHVSGATREAPRTLTSLILDLGQEGKSHAIDALRLQIPSGTSYSARVALEVSDDLKLWQSVGETDINWLVNHSAESIASDRIEFTPRPFRYARIHWIKGPPTLFTGIQAESVVTPQQQARLANVVLDAVAGRFPNDLVYRSAIAIPVTRIGLVLQQNNVVIDGTLGRYVQVKDRKAPAAATIQFDPLLKATFYRLEQGGATRVSGDLPVNDMHIGEWVLRTDEALVAKPALRLAWTASTLVFLANGRAPYKLAFGNSQARSGMRNLAQVAPGFALTELAALAPAETGPLTVQNALVDNVNMQDAPSAGRLREYVLWAALLLGVAVLGVMAARLLKQMKSSE